MFGTKFSRSSSVQCSAILPPSISSLENKTTKTWTHMLTRLFTVTERVVVWGLESTQADTKDYCKATFNAGQHKKGGREGTDQTGQQNKLGRITAVEASI